MPKPSGEQRGRLQRPAQKPPTAALPQAPLTSGEKREANTKRRGELAEIAFLHKALALGFRVSKPYGDSDRYDFITDPCNLPGRTPLYRVQVKCTTQFIDGSYHLNAHRRINGKAVPYTLDEIDFFAALVMPEDSWFIIPLSHVLGITSFMLRSKRDHRPNRYTPYREAWRLLCEPDGLTFG